MTTYGTSASATAGKAQKPAYQPYSWLFVDDDLEGGDAPDMICLKADTRTLSFASRSYPLATVSSSLGPSEQPDENSSTKRGDSSRQSNAMP